VKSECAGLPSLLNLHASQGQESKDFSSIVELYLDKTLDPSQAG